MYIKSSSVAMDSGRSYQASVGSARLSVLQAYNGAGIQTSFAPGSSRFGFTDLLRREGAARTPAAVPETQDWFGGLAQDEKQALLDLLLELLKRLTGDAGVPAPGGHGMSAVLGSAWTRQTVYTESVRCEERTAFSSTGTAVTADGRSISFGVTVEMSRSFEQTLQLVDTQTVFTDPLVINLDTDAAALSDVTFRFDLDCDGSAEELSAPGAGSGFLALDKNGDGVVNDGSELFGARSGDGFAELAQYDRDGNGWIDEGDEVFSRLSVWVKCGDGPSRLLSLADAGVGAICLDSRPTQFTLTDPFGVENARVRRTGIYLKEDGQAGTVQHVDFRTGGHPFS